MSTQQEPAVVRMQELPPPVHEEIVKFLLSIPNIQDQKTIQGLISNAGLGIQLQNQLDITGSPVQIFNLVVPILLKYGKLDDGRYALEAFLETTKQCVGTDKRAYCDILIKKLQEQTSPVESTRSEFANKDFTGEPLLLIHNSTDFDLASKIKQTISRICTNNIHIFLSSEQESLTESNDTLSILKAAIQNSKIILLLCTPESQVAPWFLFEAGAVWFSHQRFVPVYAQGLHPVTLVEPFKQFPVYDLSKPKDIDSLINLIIKTYHCASLEYDSKVIVKELFPKEHLGFCGTCDGVQIAYSYQGIGKQTLVKTTNWFNHLTYETESSVWHHWIASFSRYTRFVRYDGRGCGLSQRNNMIDFSFDKWIYDLEAVVDTLELDKFALLGVSQGGSIAIKYAMLHPERISHLILISSFARGWKNMDLSHELKRKYLDGVELLKRDWGKEQQDFDKPLANLFIPTANAEQIGWFSKLQKESTTLETASKLIDEFCNVDISPELSLLNTLDIPILIIHSIGDRVIPISESYYLARSLKKAQFISLKSENHILLNNEQEWKKLVSEVNEFLGVDS
ncbi:transcriptional regulator, LuxR-family containing alpha/beta hydrolase domain [Candidatus Vecturithrix granuli]|uniref:Transcriptional regulator, LuxR-family containing alpha/beta hydrolase domain n=1 Tax=Vecturithrix granuli TaxID=1499967 RepID=A0A081C1U1_VECG1|nr:transcriptional regulator, LuxR-family containing alpha/beta hydrolase domain [Candidatus Vecturithrix granuli]